MEKLIRDRGHWGEEGKLRLIQSKKELMRLLIEKMKEEVLELEEAFQMGNKKEEIKEELGDLYEVFMAFCREHGTSLEAVQRYAEHKKEAKGGFYTGVVWVQNGEVNGGDEEELTSISVGYKGCNSGYRRFPLNKEGIEKLVKVIKEDPDKYDPIRINVKGSGSFFSLKAPDGEQYREWMKSL